MEIDKSLEDDSCFGCEVLDPSFCETCKKLFTKNKDNEQIVEAQVDQTVEFRSPEPLHL